MKKCSSCNIEIGGNTKKCPLCGEKLSGTDEKKLWPQPDKLKKHTKLYNRQLMIVVFVCIGAFILDGIIDLIPGFQWWHLFVLWAATAEIIITIWVKKYRSLSRMITEATFAVCAILGCTSIWVPSEVKIIPILITGMIIINFIFALFDKEGHAIAFLIGGFLIWMASFIAIFIMGEDCYLTWYICLVVCSVSLFLTLILKCRFIFSQIIKKLSM